MLKCDKHVGRRPALAPARIVLYGLIPLLVIALAIVYGARFFEDEEDDYFQIQSKVIQASITRDFEPIRAARNIYHPTYLYGAFAGAWLLEYGNVIDSYSFFREWLALEHDVVLVRTESGYETHDGASGKKLNIFERRDDETIRALLMDCNTLLEKEGRLACEFDGGYDDVGTPFTTILFSVAYLKYQSQRLAYRDGRYELLEEGDSSPSLDVYDLLKRNALVRVVSRRLLSNAAFLLIDREEARTSSEDSTPKAFTKDRVSNL
jgi:hypothetical protein